VERLYAPWRLAYVTRTDDRTSGLALTGCIFCDKPGQERDSDNLILQRGKTCYVILNAFPYNNGHLMVIPYRHLSTPTELTAEEGAEMFAAMSHMLRVLDFVYHPNGYNTGMNIGAAAGAGIAAHLHLHIVPRWNGDTNFMPVIGDAKVMPETLDQTYTKIKTALEKMSPPEGTTL